MRSTKQHRLMHHGSYTLANIFKLSLHKIPNNSNYIATPNLSKVFLKILKYLLVDNSLYNSLHFLVKVELIKIEHFKSSVAKGLNVIVSKC